MKIQPMMMLALTMILSAGCPDTTPTYMPRVGAGPYQDIANAFGGMPASQSVATLLEGIRATQKDSYKILFLTDEPGGARAREVAAAFASTTPWSMFDITTEIMEKTSEELECAEGETIKRLITANRGLASTEASRNGADQAIIICNLSMHGGSGGSIPVVAANARSVQVAFHEFMHTLGFSDEYEYSASEALIYCADLDHRTGVNLAHIVPLDSYASDEVARTEHSPEIPWYSNIFAATPITQDSKLGTPSSVTNTFGLFESATCRSAVPSIPMWKPGSATSIMQSTASTVTIDGIYSNMLFDILVDKGVPLRELPSETTSNPRVNDTSLARTGNSGTSTQSDSASSTAAGL